MARKLSVPDGARQAIGALAENADRVASLAALIEALPPAERTLSKIATQFAKQASISAADARRVVAQLMSFHQLQATYSMTPVEAYEAVLESLETEAPDEWKGRYLDPFKAARKAVEGAISPSHPLYLVQKSVRLKYEHQNVLYDSNVLVDVRPIFDFSGREVKQLAITYVVEIEYNDGGSRKHLLAALDQQDVAKLKAACERAETKTIALKAALGSTQFPIIVTGEMDDD